MDRALEHATAQFEAVKAYMQSLGIDKPIHIGETGWASVSDGLYGPKGSHAADEVKQALYFNKINHWSKENKVTTVYFQPSMNLGKTPMALTPQKITLDCLLWKGKAKYALWEAVDQKLLQDLSREDKGQQFKKPLLEIKRPFGRLY